MKDEPKELARNWFWQAEQDLDDAQYNLSGLRYNVACFLAQQAAEKVLKAYLYAVGAEEVWGHSVFELCQDATAFDPDFNQLVKEAAPLDKYYIPTRYPNALPGGIPSNAFDKDDAEKAIALATKVLNFVKSKGSF